MPPTERRYGLELKRSAASTMARSGSDSRRRVGSSTSVSSGFVRRGSKIAERLSRLRRRSSGTVGVVGLPSFNQPCSAAMSWQSGQTSTYSRPSAVYRMLRSPTRSVRSQIAQSVAVDVRGATGRDYSARPPDGRLGLYFLFLPLGLFDQLLSHVRRHLVVAQEVHVVVA